MLKILKSIGPNWDALAPNRPFFANAGRGSMVLWEQEWGRVLERPYRHGGFFRFLGRRFFSKSRPVREWEIHCLAKQKGVPCVEPIGYLQRGRGWKKGFSFLTRYVENSSSVSNILNQAVIQRDALHDWQNAVFELFLHVEHPDLNLNNFLFDGQHWLILDFDKAKARQRSLNDNAIRGLSRLYRSWVKLGFAGRHKHLRLRLLILFSRRLNVPLRDLLHRVQLSNIRQVRARFY